MASVPLSFSCLLILWTALKSIENAEKVLSPLHSLKAIKAVSATRR